MRVWRDKQLIFDRDDVPTISDPEGVIDLFLIFTWWNEKDPPTQHVYVDDPVIATDKRRPRTATPGAAASSAAGRSSMEAPGVSEMRRKVVKAAGLVLVMLLAACRAAPPSPGGGPTLSERYPGDAGISSDPAALFHEDFEGGWGAGAGPIGTPGT